MRIHRTHPVVLAVVLALAASLNCFAQTPADVSGDWSIQAQVIASSGLMAPAPGTQYQFTVNVTQTDSTFTGMGMVNGQPISLSGYISGDSVSFSDVAIVPGTHTMFTGTLIGNNITGEFKGQTWDGASWWEGVYMATISHAPPATPQERMTQIYQAAASNMRSVLAVAQESLTKTVRDAVERITLTNSVRMAHAAAHEGKASVNEAKLSGFKATMDDFAFYKSQSKKIIDAAPRQLRGELTALREQQIQELNLIAENTKGSIGSAAEGACLEVEAATEEQKDLLKEIEDFFTDFTNEENEANAKIEDLCDRLGNLDGKLEKIETLMSEGASTAELNEALQQAQAEAAEIARLCKDLNDELVKLNAKLCKLRDMAAEVLNMKNLTEAVESMLDLWCDALDLANQSVLLEAKAFRFATRALGRPEYAWVASYLQLLAAAFDDSAIQRQVTMFAWWSEDVTLAVNKAEEALVVLEGTGALTPGQSVEWEAKLLSKKAEQLKRISERVAPVAEKPEKVKPGVEKIPFTLYDALRELLEATEMGLDPLLFGQAVAKANQIGDYLQGATTFVKASIHDEKGRMLRKLERYSEEGVEIPEDVGNKAADDLAKAAEVLGKAADNFRRGARLLDEIGQEAGESPISVVRIAGARWVSFAADFRQAGLEIAANIETLEDIARLINPDKGKRP